MEASPPPPLLISHPSSIRNLGPGTVTPAGNTCSGCSDTRASSRITASETAGSPLRNSKMAKREQFRMTQRNVWNSLFSPVGSPPLVDVPYLTTPSLDKHLCCFPFLVFCFLSSQIMLQSTFFNIYHEFVRVCLSIGSTK